MTHFRSPAQVDTMNPMILISSQQIWRQNASPISVALTLISIEVRLWLDSASILLNAGKLQPARAVCNGAPREPMY